VLPELEKGEGGEEKGGWGCVIGASRGGGDGREEEVCVGGRARSAGELSLPKRRWRVRVCAEREGWGRPGVGGRASRGRDERGEPEGGGGGGVVDGGVRTGGGGKSGGGGGGVREGREGGEGGRRRGFFLFSFFLFYQHLGRSHFRHVLQTFLRPPCDVEGRFSHPSNKDLVALFKSQGL